MDKAISHPRPSLGPEKFHSSAALNPDSLKNTLTKPSAYRYRFPDYEDPKSLLNVFRLPKAKSQVLRLALGEISL
jgi:hypothetical protein